ncbi:hypothetical protein JEQ04_11460 [Serratia plymuthica]|uniref:hypothetical protein n=1 Tax=Serratia plymuthica TaxID=82996 RepID=UPI0018E4BFB6|nr:hypothetical protein [Serratia plymuthica]MBI6138469.1 hypothetical protein [Serratia plymuthica]
MGMKIELIEISEPDSSIFRLDESSSELIRIFRLLSGSCKLKAYDTIVDLEINYFFPLSEIEISTTENIEENTEEIHQENDNITHSHLEFLNGYEDGGTLQHYETFIKVNKFKNRSFYRSFFQEICSAVYNVQLKKHTLAFVHIYRAYENISYAFPMIYSSLTDNYHNTFNNLRAWFSSGSSDNTGELKFLSKFIKDVFKDDELLDSSFDINIVGDANFKNRIFNTLKEKILPLKNQEEYAENHSEPDVFSIPFSMFHSFLITLRNRFFHFSHSNNNNISLDDVDDAELFFPLINKHAIQYITTLFHAIVWHSIKMEQDIVSAVENAT